MPHIRLETKDDVAWVTLDDGKVNALSEEVLTELRAQFAIAQEAASVTVLLGRAGIFSAGFDMSTFQRGAEPTAGMLGAGIDLLAAMLAHPHPIITACAGHAFPMGAFLMLCADLRLGVPGPFKIGMNEVAIGLTVPRFALAMAKHRLTPVGFARVSTGDLFAPDEAVRLGYLDELVPADELVDRARIAAERFCAVDPTAYVQTKARINGGLIETLHALGRADALSAELELG